MILKMGFSATRFASATALAALTVIAVSCPAPPANAPCNSSYDCPSDEICVDHVCRQVCNSSASCRSGEVCSDGVCLPVGDGGDGGGGGGDGGGGDGGGGDGGGGDGGGGEDGFRRDAAADAVAGDVRADSGGIDATPVDGARADGSGLDGGGDRRIPDAATGVDRADAAPRADGAGDGTPPTVIAVSPADGATGVGLRPTIEVTFSEAMAQSSVMGRVLVGNNAVAGSWSWTSSTVYAFAPAGDFGCSVQVQVNVANGAQDLSGLPLVDACADLAGAEFCSSFSTKPKHQECHEENTGTCSDNLTLRESCCSGCLESVAAPNCDVGLTYTVSCGTGCETGCHYRREYDTRTVCSDVCS
ncbi:MAG: Ig-like domain-containing protein [Deltaproteobacteria bacterium]|nr:Ig-like domain-containing protein [Deltaproteobacteria bacterium]